MAHTAATRLTALGKMRERRDSWLAANGPCKDCGGTQNLEIHHRDPAQKENHRVWSWELSHMLAELAKCTVLCRRCHNALHALTTRTHGIKQYQRGCRCETCRKGKAAQTKRWRERHRTHALLDSNQ